MDKKRMDNYLESIDILKKESDMDKISPEAGALRMIGTCLSHILNVLDDLHILLDDWKMRL